MFERFNLYSFYLRLTTYAVPLFAFAITGHICFYFPGIAAPGFSGPRYLLLMVLTTLLWMLFSEQQNLTSVTELLHENTGFRKTVAACFTTCGFLLGVLFFWRLLNFSRLFLVLMPVVVVTLNLLMRTALRLTIEATRPYRPGHHFLVVGTSKFARSVAARLGQGTITAANIAGFVRLPEQEVNVRSARVYEVDELEQLAATAGIDEIVLAVPLEKLGTLRRILPSLERFSVPLRAAIDLGEGVRIREKMLKLGPLQIFDLTTTPAESVPYLLLKRCFDIAFSATVLALASPVLAAIAIGVKLTSPGPVFFRQQRVGLNGKLFPMLKFRSMRVAPAKESDTIWTTNADPRRTAFGSFLRKTSLDELPQFFNVLRGDMSVVGPRPERPHFVRQFQSEYDRYSHRHRLKVGITGWAQIHGLRGDTSIEKRVQYDLYYLSNWSFMMDVRIVLMTPFVGLINRNAY